MRLQPPARGYNGQVFTPGHGLGPAPGQPGMPQQMRGPPAPHHHQGQRMRGPPRGAMQQQYVPQMGPYGYPPPQMSPYMMNQPPYMGGPPQMGYMPPMGMPMASPYMAMPAAPPQTVVAPREKKRLEIIDPKTKKPIQLGGPSAPAPSTPTPAPAPAPVEKAPSTTEIAKDKFKAEVEKKVEATTPKKAAPASPTKQTNGTKSPAKSPKKSPKKKAQPVATPQSPAAVTPTPATNGSKTTETPKKEKAPEAKPAPVAEAAKLEPKSPKKAAKPAAEIVSSPKPAATKTVEKKTDTKAKTISPKKKSPEASQEPISSVQVKATTVETTTRVETKSIEKQEPAKIEKTKDVAVVVETINGKATYTLEVLLSFREKFTELPAAVTGPDSKWPSMEVVNEGPVGRGGSRGGRGGWERGEKQLNRQSSRGSNSGNGGGTQWQRSQELPKRGRGERGGRGGRGGRGAPDPPLLDGPVKPLTRSANRWIPVKSASNLEVAKKKVQSVMNKMTREKFDRLAEQLTNIHMESLEMLQSVIRIIFDKALGEPHFCDMYADLCVHLDSKWQSWSFLKIVQNDDDNMFYWTTMSDADSEVVGPFDSSSDALHAANSDDFEPSPAPENLKLSEVRVQNQKFVKLWALEGASDSEVQYYWSGQHMEDLGDDQVLNGPFPTEEVANRHATKACSFKRILLNACQEEFEKDNIYEELEESFKQSKEKGELTPQDEADYDEKRIIMKGRMLGNIRFIGELYRKGMLQERIMHECIMKLMGVTVNQASELVPSHPNVAPDEENIESLCKLLSTMGKDLDRHGAQGSMQSYFHYLGTKLVKDKRLSSRTNFMIKDVIELRHNRWEPRRKELKTKTLDEIRKEAEREQRAPPASAPSGGGRSDSYRMDSRRSNSSRDGGFNNRNTMAPVYQSHSMNSRSGGSNRMTIPRNFQRDESVKTGPQGRPASFGTAARRQPSSGPSAMAKRPEAKKSAAPEAPKRESVPPLPEDAKEKVEKKAKSIAEEYVSIVDVTEADACLQEVLKEFNNHEDVSRVFAAAVFTNAIEAKAESREKMIELLEKLSVEKRSLSFDGIRHGLAKTIEISGYLWCDVPMLHEHIAGICFTYMQDSAKSGLTLDWLIGASGSNIQNDVYEELVDGGFLAAMVGCTLKLLAAASVAKTKRELHSTYVNLFSILPAHLRTAKELKNWSDKHELSAVLTLDPAFELASKLEAGVAFDDVVQWIEKSIPHDLRLDTVFAPYTCLLILSVGKSDELPSIERGMLLTGFCGSPEIQTRLVAAIIQTRSDQGEFEGKSGV